MYSKCIPHRIFSNYRQNSNIRCTLVGNKTVDHLEAVRVSVVDAAPTTSSFLTWHLTSMDWAKTTATEVQKRPYYTCPHLSAPALVKQRIDFKIFCGTFMALNGISAMSIGKLQQKFFAAAAPMLWNNLPLNIKWLWAWVKYPCGIFVSFWN